MNRRDFIKTTALSAASLGLLGLPMPAEGKNKVVRLTILHTNDTHSRIEPFPNDGRTNAGMGGMARRAALVKEIRAQEKNVLLLDSGDVFQGTPYFNFFGGELEYKLMSKMGYDATTLGNHEFDNGMEGLLKQLPHANFPFLVANYDFSNTPLAGKFLPYKVFEKQGVRIGVFGLGIELQGLVSDRNFGNTKYLDPVKVANETARILRKKENCELVICLSHLGFKYESDKISDIKLAMHTKGIDIILGGHTHTFMEKPEYVQAADGKNVLINQVGWAGINLGRIDLVFTSGRQTNVLGVSVLPVQNQLNLAEVG